MLRQKPRIYLDTTMISYCAARLHRDPVVRSRQLATRKWWQEYREHSEFCISSYVTEEIEKGDSTAATKRMECVLGVRVIAPELATQALAQKLLKELRIPHRSRMDALHLAIAAANGLDYIVSWNFKHMANAGIRAVYRDVCLDRGLEPPEITTPEEMLEQGRAQ
jgi:predicted nucleic acid-binding protein